MHLTPQQQKELKEQGQKLGLLRDQISAGLYHRRYTLYPTNVLLSNRVNEFHEYIRKCQDKVEESDRCFTIILSGNFRGNNCIQLFSKDKWLKLQVLILQNIILNLEGCKMLISVEMPDLQKLDMGYNYIDERCCKEIMKSKWPKLVRLNLGHNEMRDRGCYYLSKAQWPKLQELFINDNCITSAGCKVIEKGNFPALKALNINQNEIKEKGCVQISKFPQKLNIFYRQKGGWSFNKKQMKILNKCEDNGQLGQQNHRYRPLRMRHPPDLQEGQFDFQL